MVQFNHLQTLFKAEEIYQISAVIKCIPCWWIFNSLNLHQIWALLTDWATTAWACLQFKSWGSSNLILYNYDGKKFSYRKSYSQERFVIYQSSVASVSWSRRRLPIIPRVFACMRDCVTQYQTNRHWMSKFTNIVTSYCKHLGQFQEFSNNWILKIWLWI